MADILTPTTGATAARYSYYTVDIVTNKVLAQIPLEDVTFDRMIKGAGSFDGKITVSTQTSNLDLYNTTLPGKTAIYVMRNDVCVWGGIIWGRTYDLTGRSLTINAMEFTSYLSRRHIWKTFDYKFTADLLKVSKNGTVKVSLVNRVLKTPIPLADSNGKKTKVTVSFKDADLIKYSGDYTVTKTLDIEEPTLTQFYISIPKLPASSTPRQEVTVNLKIDTYDMVRELINSTFSDYYNVGFLNETIAPGVKSHNTLLYRRATDNSVYVTTENAHNLVTGENVEIVNLEPELNGTYTVSEIPSVNEFVYTVPTYVVTKAKVVDGVVTLTLDTSNGQFFEYPVGSTVSVTISTVGKTGLATAAAVVTSKTNSSFTYDLDFEDTSETAVSGSVLLPTIVKNESVLDRPNYKVSLRSISSTGSKVISHVKRAAGYATFWTTTPHGFRKHDAIITTINDTTTKVTSGKGTLASLSTSGTVTAATSTTFTIYQEASSAATDNILGTDSKKRIKLSTAKKNTAALATPVKRMVLATEDTHDYRAGETIYVRGVDEFTWKKPLYNGYHKIIDTDVATSTITHIVRTAGLAAVYTSTNHGYDVGDKVTISGIGGDYISFNGTYIITDVYDPPNANSGEATFAYRIYDDLPNVSKRAASGTAKTTGDDWIAFDLPEYGATKEPNDSIGLSEISYDKTSRTVTVSTATAHYAHVGDLITMKSTSKNDEADPLNGTFSIKKIISGERDKFTYVIPKSNTKAPKNDIKKLKVTGSFSRVKTKVGFFPRVEVPITRVQRYLGVTTAFVSDHDLSSGLDMTFNFPTGYESFEGDGKPTAISINGSSTFTYANPGTDFGVSTIAKSVRSGKLVTVTTSATHGYAVGQTVQTSGMNNTKLNGTFTITAVGVVSGQPYFEYNTGDSGNIPVYTYNPATSKAQAVSTKAVSATAYIEYDSFGSTETITTIQSTSNNVTIGVENHDYKVGDSILVHIYGSAYKSYNNNGNPVKVRSITENTVSYLLSSTVSDKSTTAVDGQVAFSAQVEKIPTVISRSYGEFPNNSNLGGVEFSDDNYSDLVLQNTLIRGGDLSNLGEFLDSYSNSLNGFDYRIDCSMVYDEFNNKKFKRTFVLVPRIPTSLKEYLDGLPDKKLPAGEYAPVSAFGADKVVFEYPGNIGNFGMTENASAAATRFFVSGNNDDLGSAASNRYSAASATDLLSDGWPLLDRAEKQEWPVYGVNVVNVDNYGNYDAEADFNKTANRFLNESKPPMSELNISVNGSMNPIIGTYSPGDWCSIVINEPFFQSRLASNLEPRKNVIIRKIDRINVTVPNNPAFPEQVTLDLVPEWEVDKRGQ